MVKSAVSRGPLRSQPTSLRHAGDYDDTTAPAVNQAILWVPGLSKWTPKTVVLEGDSRLTDTRTPGDGSVTNAKVAAAAAIAESKLSLASDAAAGTASRRSLGTGAQQAAAGNDSRLSDARTPLAHTHALSDVPTTPKGVVGRAYRSTSPGTTTATSQATAQNILRLDTALKAGRLYRYTVQNALVYCDSGNTRTGVPFFAGSTSGAATRASPMVMQAPTPLMAVAVSASVTLTYYYTPASDVTYSVFFGFFGAQAGTYMWSVSASYPIQVICEDLGVDSGDTGVVL